ncbi:hypothetical protein [Halovivax limisalsi]|uniref:hypothetical protein n=1 Tax=Halovivax limisalsi TaxID=1453760 RepID=UPI001FFDCE04|nr:hypothetical protein [Halovivax limisalsi]
MTDTQPDGRIADESTDRSTTDESNTGHRSGTANGHRESDESKRSSGEALVETTTNGRSDDETARRIRMLYWAALGVCTLLALVALSRFYASIEAAIDVWIAAEYRPIASGAFNFAVLLVALVGVSAAIRRLSH